MHVCPACRRGLQPAFTKWGRNIIDYSKNITDTGYWLLAKPVLQGQNRQGAGESKDRIVFAVV
jgi:hypothetical protein